MTFDTDQATVFQIRRRHRNQEVRELIPSDYAGVMVTDRGKSYDAEKLLGVRQQKCLDHWFLLGCRLCLYDITGKGCRGEEWRAKSRSPRAASPEARTRRGCLPPM